MVIPFLGKTQWYPIIISHLLVNPLWAAFLDAFPTQPAYRGHYHQVCPGDKSEYEADQPDQFQQQGVVEEFLKLSQRGRVGVGRQTGERQVPQAQQGNH